MGFFDFFFGKKSEMKVTKNKSIEPQAPAHFVDLAKQNSDIVDGLIFSATCQVRTPLNVLLKHGEIYQGNDAPPTYGRGAKDGIWLPKVRSDYSYDNDGNKAASDAGHVLSDDYIKFAIGLRTIFESNLPTIDKMEKIINYGDNLDDKIKYIAKNVILNRGGSKGEEKDNLADVMANHLSDTERKIWYFDKPNHLNIIDGVNKKVVESLENNGFTTMQKIAELKVEELVILDGIGKVSAKKIAEDCLNIKELR
ncbi:MAG: hypothetical protein COA76_10150 [Moritella sp.]|nr:MAG: hypothetical protein COA76_10150 [Moritella sp.]